MKSGAIQATRKQMASQRTFSPAGDPKWSREQDKLLDFWLGNYHGV
jgi:hypothetical protein